MVDAQEGNKNSQEFGPIPTTSPAWGCRRGEDSEKGVRDGVRKGGGGYLFEDCPKNQKDLSRRLGKRT